MKKYSGKPDRKNHEKKIVRNWIIVSLMMKSDCLYRNGLCELNCLSLVCWKGCRQNRLAEISSLTWIDSANMNMNHIIWSILRRDYSRTYRSLSTWSSIGNMPTSCSRMHLGGPNRIIWWPLSIPDRLMVKRWWKRWGWSTSEIAGHFTLSPNITDN